MPEFRASRGLQLRLQITQPPLVLLLQLLALQPLGLQLLLQSAGFAAQGGFCGAALALGLAARPLRLVALRLLSRRPVPCSLRPRYLPQPL